MGPHFSSAEEERLSALDRLDILDTAAERAFDELAELAADLCEAPIALVSFVDRDRQWFKAVVGLEVTQTPRSESFCAWAIQQPTELFVVEDALEDPRFATNRLVTGAPNVRFYAGAPVVTASGAVPGTLCIIDTRPRVLSARQRRTLQILSRQVALLLDLRERTRLAEQLARERDLDIARQKAAEEERRLATERLELALSGGDIGLWDLDLATGQATYNDQWWRMFGYAPGEIQVVDGLWKSMVHPSDYAQSRAGLAAHVAGDTPMYEGEVRVRHKDGRWLWIENRAKVVRRDATGLPLRIVGINLNITKGKQDRIALAQTGELLNRTAALAKVGGWELDTERMALTWSDEVYRMHDLPVGSPMTTGQAIAFYAPDARALMGKAVEEGTASGAGWDLELPLVTAKGRQIWVRARGQAERDGDRVVRVYGTIQDVTETRVIRDKLKDEERRMRLITDHMPASVTHFDVDERYTFANRFAGEFFGVDPQHMVGRTMREVRGEGLYAMLEPHVKRALNGTTASFESEGSIDGRKYFAQSTFIPDIAPDGGVQGYYAMTFDVTESKEAAARSRESERRLRGLTDNVPVLLTELDIDRRVVFCNGRFETWLGIPPSKLIGRPIREVVSEARYAMRKGLLDRAYAGETVAFEQSAMLLVGERTLQTTYLPHTDSEGRVAGLYIVAYDVSDMKQKHLQLHALASEDALTGLPNRRSFEERFVEALARSRRSGAPMALMYLDIDHFKSINDSLGHAAGDAVLKEFGRRLHTSVRATDMAARYAGDEFVVLLEGLGREDDAAIVAAKILRAMQPGFALPTGSMALTTSIGIAIAQGETEDFQPLLARADAALYAAKKGGRNQFRLDTQGTSGVLRA